MVLQVYSFYQEVRLFSLLLASFSQCLLKRKLINNFSSQLRSTCFKLLRKKWSEQIFTYTLVGLCTWMYACTIRLHVCTYAYPLNMLAFYQSCQWNIQSHSKTSLPTIILFLPLFFISFPLLFSYLCTPPPFSSLSALF